MVYYIKLECVNTSTQVCNFATQSTPKASLFVLTVVCALIIVYLVKVKINGFGE